jgi:RNA polymerase sigma factor (sigma-70 family)
VAFADEASGRPVEVVRARRATAGDLGRLYALRGPAFVRVAAGICGEAAPDAVQDAFVRALARVGSLRTYGALEGWVWRIVLNEARRRRAPRVLVDVPARHGAVEPEEPDPRSELVRAVIQGLPQRQREITFLRYFADLDERSIATALHVRRGTVAATLHQVRARVRAAMEEQGIEG